MLYSLEGMLGNFSIYRNLIHTHHNQLFLTLNKSSKIVIFVIFIICPLWRPRGISQLVSGLYYVTRDTGCNIHIGAKLYPLGRAKVFSSVATYFGLKTRIEINLNSVQCVHCVCITSRIFKFFSVR